ncbi:hypothetical protein N7U49_48370 (plasmid) [Streptomyces sp. AD2-2]|nr:hypothetical protein N7U49_48370 [Streptomyces sp. AD2-2]
MAMTPAELEAQKDTLELLNNEVAARLTRQSDSLAKIDTKAVFLIGFAATAAQFLATHKHHDVLAYCAFAAYAITLLTGVHTMRVAEHKDLEPRVILTDNVAFPKSQHWPSWWQPGRRSSKRTSGVIRPRPGTGRSACGHWLWGLACRLSRCCCTLDPMSDEQNQGSGQPASTSAPAPAPQPDFVDAFTNPAMIGTEKKSDDNPTLNKAVRPQDNTETR